MTAQAYPLQWPHNVARRKQRVNGAFSTNKTSSTKQQVPVPLSIAISRLLTEIDRLGGTYIVISSNLEIRQDGLPRGGQRAPDDPGICVYFQLAGKPRAMPCDTYTKVEQNIAAVAAHIAAVRAIERYGVATVAQMFEGFTALPPPSGPKPKRPWWDVLQVRSDASKEAIEANYRSLARTRHPDAGGSQEAMSELNHARDEALKDTPQ